MERETRFELATLALARRCSTTELLPRTTELSISGQMGWVKLELRATRRPAFHPGTFNSWNKLAGALCSLMMIDKLFDEDKSRTDVSPLPDPAMVACLLQSGLLAEERSVWRLGVAASIPWHNRDGLVGSNSTLVRCICAARDSRLRLPQLSD